MKKPASLFTTLLILSSSIILSSCGGGNSKPKTTFAPDAIMTDERNLTPDEKNIATRICYAYQSKSQKFRSTEFYGTQFIFQAKNTDCQNLVTTTNITTTMKYDAQNELAYIPSQYYDPSLAFNKKVQTDSSGYLAQLCPKVLTNQQVTNTITEANVKIQISFFKEDYDGYLLQYFNRQVDNTYKIDSAEKFKVPSDPGAVIRGMDQFYSAAKICTSPSDKNKFANFEQNFISR